MSTFVKQSFDPSDREALREDIGRAVMDWHLKTISWAYSDQATLWHTRDDVPILTRQTWRPDEDDAQCMRVLDRMAELGFEYSLSLTAGLVCATFARPGAEPSTAEHAERRLAILLGALAALRR